ncbi:hypothetical protein [Leeuwenhoekiella nanhaiensis]|uniref:VWA domain-containing protein n=1 Tax=Leeuwenhoekiella nanhaiensis TaxID=1655491 RepID=A0A2G1VTL1_9FLAO|nr:hypothetical protein [Leeuwenhoekiella nanhaiensis]PHQ30123.1 hypothetical protein CJ305_03935 [Leeuwenhoekiella nanhaiensis]
MAASTLFFIILFGVIALGAAVFFYFYKPQGSLRLRIILAGLRFLALFALLILLLNPSLKKATYTTLKPKLALAVDNSASIAHLGYGDSVNDVLRKFQNSDDLNARFDIDYYAFGSSLKSFDSLTFQEKQTDISKALSSIYSIYKKDDFTPLLITDGNANLGSNYTYTVQDAKQSPHYFVAVGDTTSYEDLSVDRVNVNKYGYLRNRFPVEIMVSYAGEEDVSTTVSIQKNGTTLYKEAISLSSAEPAQRLNTFIEASSIGTETYDVRIGELPEEKNTANNSKRFGIEIIDQRSKILITYSILHPDLGTLKKAFESNQLRTVTLKKSTEVTAEELNDYNLIVLFEPQRSFTNLYTALNNLNKNRITIAGPVADRRFLNQVQDVFKLPLNNQTEAVQAIYNLSFSSFQLDDTEFSNFPPLEVAFGEIDLNASADVILNQRITGIETSNPLLAAVETNGRREVVLFGTGIFKWRSQSYLDTRSFETFDNFIEKLAQFSAADTRRNRLQSEHERFYYGGSGIAIRAQFFDKNYVFDSGARLQFELNNTSNGFLYQSPMVLSRTNYTVNLPNLEPGSYTFQIQEMGSNLSTTGSFTVIEYNIENQVIQADYTKMKSASQSTGGMAVTINTVDLLIDQLLSDKRYTPIQRETVENVPLIQFWWLLLVIALAAATEWFIRKYNGLI